MRCVGPHANALVFTYNFDRNVFNFCGVELSPKDFNNKAPGHAAHPGFGGGLSMNAEGVRQTALLSVVKPFQGLRWLIRANDLWCAARPQAVLLNSFAVG